MANKAKTYHFDLLRLHLWGCLDDVLDTKLKNDQKTPKWNLWSLPRQLICFPDKYFLLVANVCHLKTGYISPQYHVVFDNMFQTVFSLGDNNVAIDAISTDLWDSSHNWYAKHEYKDGQMVYKQPPLNEVWIDETACCNCKYKLAQYRRRREEREWINLVYVPDILPADPTSNHNRSGIPITDDGTSDSNDDYFTRPA